MVPLPLRFHLRHLVLILCLLSLSLFFFAGRGSFPLSLSSPSSAAQKARERAKLLEFCPYSTSFKHVPTVILQGDQASDSTANRTWELTSGSPSSAKPVPFLPYAYPPRDLRLAQQMPDVQRAPTKPGQGRLHEGVPGDEKGKQLCKVHEVPSSPRPRVPEGWKPSSVMFGMSTVPDRVLWNLPVWSHWVPAHSSPLDPTNPVQTSALPMVLVLTPPPNPTESARTREAVEEAQGMGMYVEMRPREAERFETRYFALAEEMWKEAQRRQRDGGIKTDWFIFGDDDTFFPDFDSLARLLSSYDPEEDRLIGSHCLAKFGASFGGDAMISHCAALVMDKDIKEALTLDETVHSGLHQLDIRGDGTGFFQSGFLITSLHHWGSWFTLFPPWHESGAGDLRKGISLVGKAAQAVGGDNWGRRYVFEGGKVFVSLGYSITVAKEPVSESDLAMSEHTWWDFETFHPTRPGQEEGLDKRTYYMTGVRTLSTDGIFRLEHKNREGERVDLVWDGRQRKHASWW
ncbi:SPOSA6832_03781, partial [Sporobolomyces salmonicolor]